MTRRIIGIVCVLGLLATCGRKAQPPTSPSPNESTPGSQVVPVIQIIISGPNPVPPGETVQYTATARLGDGTTQDVTPSATWRSSNPGVLSVTPAGLVTAVTAGEGFLTATYQGRSASLSVVSLPSGTGILSGYVREAGFPINGARAEIVGGAFGGRAALTNVGGFYRMYGVVGDLQVRASSDGYIAQTIPIAVLPLASPRRDQMLNFDLTPASPVLSLSGNYRVTLRASPSCASRLPAEVLTRDYVATITQDRTRITIVLGGAEFATVSGFASNRFEGRSKPSAVELLVGTPYYYYYYYYYSYGFVEHILRPPVGKWGFSQSSYLTVSGKADGPATTASLSTTLNGTLALVDAPSGFSGRRTTIGTCRAADHQLLFTRQ